MSSEFAEHKKYYEDRFSMFCEQGWKDLMEDVQAMIDARERLGGINTIEELQYAKGELSVMNWLKSLEQVSRAAYDQLKGEDSANF